MAGHVIIYIKNDNRDCSYFFKNLTAGKSTVADLLCSLAWQMAATDKAVRDRLFEMVDSGMTIDNKDERSIWRIVFTSRIFRVEQVQAQYWVIDRLDECANYAPLLAKIEKRVRLRILLTSQPLLLVEQSFSRENIARITETITADAFLGDIRRFIQ